jgi:2-oxoisovalerate dehydrogenase E2 component (dihydrolipoyl transacylase)
MSNYIMKVPDVGEGVVEVEIVEWLVQPGENVDEDQHIVDVMTDKATVEITSPVKGVVISSSGEPGDMLPVGSEMIVFDSETENNEAADATSSVHDEEPSKPAPEPAPELVSEPAPEPEPEPEPEKTAAPVQNSKPVESEATHPEITASRESGLVLAAPAVRRRAREAHVDLSLVKGTGRGGRIIHEDLDAFIEGGLESATAQARQERSGERQIKVIGLRRLIAEKMALSSRHIAHFSYVEEVDITDLEALRQHLNANRKEHQPKLSYMPFFMHAIAKLVLDFPVCNAHFDDEAGIVTQFDAVHIGVASQTNNGLMVPVVRQAESMDLWQLATNAIRVSEAAKNNTASKEELTGSTITITSLGALGGLASTPVINHPEVAIIGINKSQLRPVIQDGQVVPRLMILLRSLYR